jgi:hypothetical protein
MAEVAVVAANWVGSMIGATLTAVGVSASVALPVAAFAANVTYGVSIIALNAGMSYAIDAVSKPKIKPPGSELAFNIDPDYPREMVIGQRMVGGSMVARYSRGSNLYNAHLVIQLADHPCHELSKVYDGGRLVRDTPLTHGTRTEITAYSSSGGARVWMTWRDGRPGQTADSDLVTKSAQDPEVIAGKIEGWTSNHVGAGCAYVHVEVQWDSDILTSIPQFQFLVKGAKLYDRRLDTTAGGSGSHRHDDPSTWAYSTNAMVALDHFLLGYQVEDDPLAFGIGLSPTEVPYAQFEAAADLCDEDVETGVGGAVETIKRYAINGVVSAGDFFEDVVEAMQLQMAARVVDLGGRIGILGAEERAITVSLTEDDLVAGEPLQFADKLQFTDLIGTVTGTFSDPGNNYQPSPYAPLTSAYAALPDGGEAQATTLPFPYEVHPRRVVRLASAWMERESLQPRLAGVFMPKAWKLEPGDWFEFTSDRLQITAEKFEVIDIVKNDDFTVTITARAIDPAFLAFDNDNDPDLSVPPDVPPVSRILATPTFTPTPTTISGGGATEPVIQVVVDAPNPVARELIIEVREWNGTALTGPSLFFVGHADELTSILRQGLKPDTAYKIRMKARAGSRESAWSEWSSAITMSSTYIVPAASSAAPGSDLDVDFSAAIAAAAAAAASATTAAGHATNAALAETNAETAETAAEAALSAATTQATNAATSATSAGSSATSAAGSATTATTQAGNAATSASAALASQTAAAGSASAASSSASSAAASQSAAASSASAANTSATNAATSASNASTSASNASTSETNAAGSASTASTAATAAASSQSAAAGSATAASSSASTASTQASNAATSASAASTSATNAATQASNASTSAGAASTSAGNAAASATTASTQASNAAGSASSASSSASSASASATAASNSATLSATFASGSQGTINSSATFADNANATGVPTNWSDWQSGGDCSRVTGIAPQPYAVTIPGAAGFNAGIQQALDGRITQGWHVIEADVTLNSGAFTAAGVHLNWGPSGGINNSFNLTFANTEDVTGVAPGSGTTGRLYKFRTLININTACDLSYIYCMSHWNGFGSVASANSITWHRCAVRAASQAEVEARQAKNDLVTTNANVATNTSAIATETSARAAADTTLTASVNAALAPSVNLVPYPSGTARNNPYGEGVSTATQGWIVAGGQNGNGFVNGYWDPAGGPILFESWTSSYTSGSDRFYVLEIPISFAETYTLSWNGYVSGFNAAGAGVYMDALNGGTYINSSALVPFSSGGNVSTNRRSLTFTPGTGANKIKIIVYIPAQTVGSYCDLVFRALQLERGSVATKFNEAGRVIEGEKQIGTLTASVAEVKTAVVDTGGAYSYYGLKVGAGNRFASIEALASTKTNVSQLKMTADKFTIFNSSSDVAVFDVTGSQIKMTADLNVSAGISVGAARLKVALESILKTGADGAAITWADGVSIGSAPAYVLDLSTLAPLTAGETYSVTLTGVTATGATVYAKILTPGTTSTVTQTTDAAGGGGDPTRVMAKTDSADAYNGVYNFRVVGNMTITGTYDGDLGQWINSGILVVSTWFNDGGGWDQGPNIEFVSFYAGATDDSGTVGVDDTFAVAWANAIGAGATYDFGVSAVSGGTVTDLHTVSYLKQTSSGLRTASPSGETVKITAFPRNA